MWAFRFATRALLVALVSSVVVGCGDEEDQRRNELMRERAELVEKRDVLKARYEQEKQRLEPITPEDYEALAVVWLPFKEADAQIFRIDEELLNLSLNGK